MYHVPWNVQGPTAETTEVLLCRAECTTFGHSTEDELRQRPTMDWDPYPRQVNVHKEESSAELLLISNLL
jgi:hypothetical protein